MKFEPENKIVCVGVLYGTYMQYENCVEASSKNRLRQ